MLAWTELEAVLNVAQRSGSVPGSSEQKVVLTRRQAECLAWVEAGKTAWEIGCILGISPRTVEGYLANAYERLDVVTKVQAVVRARRLGLLRDPPG